MAHLTEATFLRTSREIRRVICLRNHPYIGRRDMGSLREVNAVANVLFEVR